MRIFNFVYLIKEGITNFKDRKITTYLTVLIFSISLFIITVFSLFSINFNRIMKGIIKKSSMVIYLTDTIENGELNHIRDYVRNSSSVKSVKYYSKEAALKELKMSSTDLPALIESLPENPLPAYIEVMFETADKEKVYKLKSEIEKFNSVENVDYSDKTLRILLRISKFVNYTFWVISIVIGIFIIFIVFNTIKLTVYSRNDEIEILKLTGASPGFIRLPFLVEGLLQGIISSCIALFLSYFIFKFIVVKIQYLPVFDLQLVFFDTFQVSIILICGILLGLIGSYLALKSFIDFETEN